jgi:hypothetical protein
MPSYFECLQCNVVTPVEATPPKCSGCGHSTGVLHESKPESSSVGNVQEQKPTAVSTCDGVPLAMGSDSIAAPKTNRV